MRNHVSDVARIACFVVALGACAKSDNSQRATDSAAAAALLPESTSRAAPAMPAPAAALSFADVAGKWNMRSVPEAGDTTPTLYTLTARPDSTGWTLAFRNGPTVKAHVMASGDSIMMDAGPYASVRRKGMQVTTHSVMRKQGDRLVGHVVAHYKTTKPDSVLRLTAEGTRAP